MLMHLMRASLRKLCRERLYAAINIAGLALAVFAVLILGLHLHAELGYDRHHALHDRIFRVANAFYDYDTGNQRREVAVTSAALGPLLAGDFPEVEAYARFFPESGSTLLRNGTLAFYWDRVFHADNSVFQIFTHEILHGDPANALADPNAVAISERVARAYFGDTNPVGEVLELDDGSARTVSLVFADLPANSHLQYDVLLSLAHPEFSIAEADVSRMLFGASMYTYLLMPPGYAAEDFAANARTFFQRHMEQLSRERTNRAWNGWLQPLASLHLGPDLLNDQPTGSRNYLYGFAAVVAFILLTAGINYTNLATAGFAARMRETGIRKLLGSGRLPLLAQYLLESVLLMLISLVVGVLAVELSLDQRALPALLGSVLTLDLAARPGLVLLLLGSGLAFAMLAGLYPAFYLASFKPLAALSGARKSDAAGGSTLREALLLLQFTISSGVLACTVLLALQMAFLARQPLGFAQDDRIVLTVHNSTDVARIDTLREQLLRDERVFSVTYANTMMGQDMSVNATAIDTEEGERRPVQLAHMAVAPNFVEAMGMRLVTGRDFDLAIATDATAGLIVNQALVDYMQWEQPLGKTLRSTWGSEGTVIGVVANFNFRSLHAPVEPFFMYQAGFSTPGRIGDERQLVIHVNDADLAGALAFVESTLAAFNPAEPFAYRFLDDQLTDLYQDERGLLYLIGLFAGICVAITCLGVLGLASHATERRTKEISIRQVLGAGHLQIVLLLFWRTALLALAGTCLATGLSWRVMAAWLDGFAYRIELEPLVFVGAGLAVLLLAFATVALQALRIGRIRPVQTLRYE